MSCQKEDIQSMGLRFDNERVSPFFVTRRINTNQFTVYKGVHMIGDEIPWEDIVLSIDVPEDQLNSTFDLTANDQWAAWVARDMVLYSISPEEIESDKSSKCRIKYLGGSQFDMDLQMHIKPHITHISSQEIIRPQVVEFFYKGNVFLIDSEGKFIESY